MRLQNVQTLLIIVAAAATAVTCTSDAPLAPQSATAPPESAAHSLSTRARVKTTHVQALQRSAPLATNESVSAKIGVFGGYLSLPNAKLTVLVPPFAVTGPTVFTVTALAGSNVAYDFAPHGIAFGVPIIAIQDLRSTGAKAGGLIDPAALFVGYFPDSRNVTRVSELLKASIDPRTQVSAVAIWHFSGYTWSSGRDDDPQGGGVPTPP
jgi:hypothetical protein